jgi:hypothetical protein
LCSEVAVSGGSGSHASCLARKTERGMKGVRFRKLCSRTTIR